MYGDDGVRRQLLAVVMGVLFIIIGSTVATAAVTLNTNTQYDGTNGDSQAIGSQLTLSPNESQITDVTITVQGTDSGFVDYDSFERSINPGNADINVTYVGNGRFRIDEIQPSEEVTITFESYPRSIKSQSLDVASVRIEYVQQGQSLTDRRTVSADLSTSSWFALQDAQNRIQQMQLAFYGGIAAIVILIAVLAIIGYQRLTDGGTGGGGNGDVEFET